MINDLSTNGTWIEIGLESDGTQLTRIELRRWHDAQRGGPELDMRELSPDIVAVVRAKHANITVEDGKQRPVLNLESLGADLLYSTDLRRVPAGERVLHVERAGEVADRLS